MAQDQKVAKKIKDLTIGFRSLGTGHIVLNMKVNGADARFIIDTGAGATILDKERSEKLITESFESDELGTGAGADNLSMQIAKDVLLSFGTVDLPVQDIFLMDLGHVNKALNEANEELIDGVIGADILRNYQGVIDYASSCLRIKIKE